MGSIETVYPNSPMATKKGPTPGENRAERRLKKKLSKLNEAKVSRSFSVFDAKFGGVNSKRAKNKTQWLNNKCK